MSCNLPAAPCVLDGREAITSLARPRGLNSNPISTAILQLTNTATPQVNLPGVIDSASVIDTNLLVVVRQLDPSVKFFVRRLPYGSHDVEDLVQDTLIAIHVHRASYDQTQAFSPWAYAIARHKLIDHYRKWGRRESVPLEEAGELSVEDKSAAVEARRDIDHGLARLSVH